MPRETVFKPVGKIQPITIPKDTFDEYLREVGVFKAIEGEKTGSGTTTIYTVPVGYVFYLISAQLNCRTDDAVVPTSAMSSLLLNSMMFLALDPPDVIKVSSHISLGPTIPIKLNAGESIKVVGNDAKIYSHGIVSGYEIKVSDKVKFLK